MDDYALLQLTKFYSHTHNNSGTQGVFSSASKHTNKVKRVQHEFVPNLQPKLHNPFNLSLFQYSKYFDIINCQKLISIRFDMKNYQNLILDQVKMGFELRNHKSLPQNTVKMFIELNQTRFHLKFQASTGFDLIHTHFFLRSSHI